MQIHCISSNQATSTLYWYLAQHDSTDKWISDRFAKFNCKGLISNKNNLPVMVQKNSCPFKQGAWEVYKRIKAFV